VRPGRVPQPSVGAKARRKLLKTGKLQVYQFGAKLPSFSAGKGLAEIGNTLGQRAQR